jgi:hypothetical protein
MNKWLYTISGSYVNNTEHFNNNNNNKCLTYCGEHGKYLCMKNFVHSHDVNSKQVLFVPNCGHCVSNPSVYYVNSNIHNLISSNKRY